eukprot:scaffold27824_cov17-Tisochrysis_lutea.AAC.1
MASAYCISFHPFTCACVGAFATLTLLSNHKAPELYFFCVTCSQTGQHQECNTCFLALIPTFGRRSVLLGPRA